MVLTYQNIKVDSFYGLPLSTVCMFFQVNFEDVHCMYPGLYSAQVTVGDRVFGPKRNSSKKMARKLVAIVALKELMNWEPREGKLDNEPQYFL